MKSRGCLFYFYLAYVSVTTPKMLGAAVGVGNVDVKAICGSKCSRVSDCRGFFYNTLSKYCSIVLTVSLPDTAGCELQPDSMYYMLLDHEQIDCHGYTSDDFALVTDMSSNREVCYSYNFTAHISDIDLSQHGCGVCWCCKTKGCYSGSAQGYTGTWSTSTSGKACRNWDQTQLLGPFPDGETAAAAQNFCRDPLSKGYPWCYTTDLEFEWEQCDIPLCP